MRKKFSIKEAKKLYGKMVKVEEKLKPISYIPIKKKPQPQEWVTIGGSSNFNNKVVVVNSWQTGAKS